VSGKKIGAGPRSSKGSGETVAGTDPDDARELLNYRDAFEFVSGYLNDGGPMTEGLIREIHQRLVSGVRGGAARPSEYRRVQNYVVNSVTRQVIYTPPPPQDVAPMMAELVAWPSAEPSAGSKGATWKRPG
jgi:Fic family protein